MTETVAGAGVAVRPRLRHCTLLDPGEGSPVTMIVGREQFELSEEVGDRDTFLHVKSLLDGRHTIAEISERTLVPEARVAELVATFGELGLLRTEAPLDAIPVREFVERLEGACEMWGRQIGYHRLFQDLRNGAVRAEVFRGWMLETYHYVKSAQRHVAVALAHCDRPEWQTLLAEYLAEEHDHSPLVLDTLENLGIPRERAQAAHPLIGTMSLVNALCEAGRSSTLAYLACTLLFEARAADYERARDDFHAIAERYGYSAQDVGPVVAHLTGDIEAGHTSLLVEALEGQETISAQDAHAVVNVLHDVKHSFDQYHDGILQYYADVSNYIPRLKVDYFSL